MELPIQNKDSRRHLFQAVSISKTYNSLTNVITDKNKTLPERPKDNPGESSLNEKRDFLSEGIVLFKNLSFSDNRNNKPNISRIFNRQ